MSLHFLPPSSCFEPSFWEELYDRKLNSYKLDENLDINSNNGGTNHCKPISVTQAPSLQTSFTRDSFSNGADERPVEGVLIVLNTVEKFRDIDKKELLQRQARQLLQNMQGSFISSRTTSSSSSSSSSSEKEVQHYVYPAAVENPSLLRAFTLLTFPDLKTYRFTYWFAAPVVLPLAAMPFASSAFSSDTFSTSTVLVELYWALFASVNNTAVASSGSAGRGPFVDTVFAFRLNSGGSSNNSHIKDDSGDCSSGDSSGDGNGDGSGDGGSGYGGTILTLRQAWPLRFDERTYFVSLESPCPSSFDSPFSGEAQPIGHANSNTTNTINTTNTNNNINSSLNNNINSSLNNTSSHNSSEPGSNPVVSVPAAPRPVGWSWRNFLALAALDRTSPVEEGEAGRDFGGIDTTDADKYADAANPGASSTTTASTDEIPASAAAAAVAKAERRKTVRIVGLRGPLVDRAVACARKARVRNKTNQEVPSLPQPPPTTTTAAASSAEEEDAEAEASAAAAAVVDGEDGGFEIPGYFSTLSDADIFASDRSVCAEVVIDSSAFDSTLVAPPGATSQQQQQQHQTSDQHQQQQQQQQQREQIRVVGWEANERGKPGPRVADLSASMDSRQLMAQAVDLNLRLMKWRLWPELDTERVARTRCLLLGAGTLGCAVARALVGWGVRKMTFVDSGKVSFSNPSRQCLFEFEDAKMGTHKAAAAATRVKRIFPDIDAEGVVLSIPLPGHPVSERDVDAARQATATLSELVNTHDCVFLLTDTRESRWLPTVLCAAADKPLINCALGFDSWLVMRHGDAGCSPVDSGATARQQPSGSNHATTDTQTDTDTSNSSNFSANNNNTNNTTSTLDACLGCYFCTDVVAAGDSTRNRPLDQQCTVTRPGLSSIAAATAVELLVAMLQEGTGAVSHALPHQIRGSVANFSQQIFTTPAFSCCTACSAPVVQAWRSGGFDFVKRVCEDSSLLEALSGISRLMEGVDVDMCVESDDDF